MATAKTTKADKFDFGAKLQELEAITQALEQDGADLDQGLAQFDEGMKLVAELRQYLNETVGRVEAIKQKYDLPEAPAEDGLMSADTLPF